MDSRRSRVALGTGRSWFFPNVGGSFGRAGRCNAGVGLGLGYKRVTLGRGGWLGRGSGTRSGGVGVASVASERMNEMGLGTPRALRSVESIKQGCSRDWDSKKESGLFVSRGFIIITKKKKNN